MIYTWITPLHYDHLDPLSPMKRMPPAAPPSIRIQPFPIRRRRHPTDMIQDEPARDDHPRLLVVFTASKVLAALADVPLGPHQAFV